MTKADPNEGWPDKFISNEGRPPVVLPAMEYILRIRMNYGVDIYPEVYTIIVE